MRSTAWSLRLIAPQHGARVSQGGAAGLAGPLERAQAVVTGVAHGMAAGAAHAVVAAESVLPVLWATVGVLLALLGLATLVAVRARLALRRRFPGFPGRGVFDRMVDTFAHRTPQYGETPPYGVRVTGGPARYPTGGPVITSYGGGAHPPVYYASGAPLPMGVAAAGSRPLGAREVAQLRQEREGDQAALMAFQADPPPFVAGYGYRGPTSRPVVGGGRATGGPTAHQGMMAPLPAPVTRPIYGSPRGTDGPAPAARRVSTPALGKPPRLTTDPNLVPARGGGRRASS